MEDIHKYVEEHLELLPTDKVLSGSEAEKRANAFLIAIAVLAQEVHTMTNDKIKAKSLKATEYNVAFSGSTKTNAPGREADAEAADAYIAAREDLETVDNNIQYIQTMMEVFTNAHLLLRQIAKGQG